jgi:hypothetical protein
MTSFPSQPVYIVSGYMRSGTSMMMKALIMGGMTGKYSTEKDRILNRRFEGRDYHPNPEGFYELGPKDFESADFPQNCEGRLIKALHWRLGGLPPFRYNVVFMLRNPREIEVSYLKMFGHRPPFVLQKYGEFIEKTLSKLEERKDMTVTTVWHHEMIRDPLKTMEKLIAAGFPVTNPGDGAKAVNPGLYRSKPEDIDEVRQTIPNLRTDLPDILS